MKTNLEQVLEKLAFAAPANLRPPRAKGLDEPAGSPPSVTGRRSVQAGPVDTSSGAARAPKFGQTRGGAMTGLNAPSGMQGQASSGSPGGLGSPTPPKPAAAKSVSAGPVDTASGAARAPKFGQSSSGMVGQRSPLAPKTVTQKFDPGKLKNPYG